jgi:hypothetical protein
MRWWFRRSARPAPGCVLYCPADDRHQPAADPRWARLATRELPIIEEWASLMTPAAEHRAGVHRFLRTQRISAGHRPSLN